MRTQTLLAWALAATLPAGPVLAHSGDVIPSPGVSGAIDVTSTGNLAEWASADHFTIDNGHPNTAEIWAQHKGDGIYIRAAITDGSPADTDALFLYLDLSHDGSAAPDADDWGIQIQRNEIARMGPATANPATWNNILAGDRGFSPDPLVDDPWIVELRIPNGALDGSHTLDFTTDGGKIGCLVQVFSAFEFGDPLSATYNQWPDNPADLPLQDDPGAYGNYEFDPATTFPDVAVLDIRNNFDGSENYRHISKIAVNDFEVEVSNPAGPVLGAANGVRINLYLAARGIGESFHRIDSTSLLDSDCTDFSSADWPANGFSGVSKSEVCSGNASLDDVGTQNAADIIANTADYTVKNAVNRVGGDGISIAAGFSDWLDILTWNTNAAQDAIYSDHGGVRLDHQCMKAEAIVENDPNTTNNLRQRNMDFVSVSALRATSYSFLLGWAGFREYDPGQGKDMVLHVRTRNMGEGWGFHLENAERIANRAYVAKIQGKDSLQVQAVIDAPDSNVLGRPLKEHLLVPPQAGGLVPQAPLPSGLLPVFVEVAGGSEIAISHFSFDPEEVQYVDLDGDGELLGPNGPNGQSDRLLKKFLDAVGKKERILLAPESRLGALVGSFDGFRTAFTIGEGVVVDVPPDATHLALAINGVLGLFGDNAGTGFRVKVTELRPGRQASRGFGLIADAEAQERPDTRPRPLSDIMPTACVEGYEPIGQTQNIGGKEHRLLRYLGDVCWGVINVFPQDRPEEPDKGDPPPKGFVGGSKEGWRRCGLGRGDRVVGALVVLLVGLTWLGRRTTRRRR